MAAVVMKRHDKFNISGFYVRSNHHIDRKYPNPFRPYS